MWWASGAPGLTLKCQEALGSKQPPQDSQVMGAAARVEAAARMVRPHGQTAAMNPLLARRVVPVGVSACRHKIMASCRARIWAA